ncbi:MAG: DNA repair protein RadC [Treponema sp.]|jgi:DNA repair protein RadC|nr:DNA repair protein RadC [Treponema sp.]
MKENLYPGFIGALEVHDRAGEKTRNPWIISADERPRERLLSMGPEALSDHELLAILLNTGIRGKNVAVLAGELLERLDRHKDIPPVKEITRLCGLGLSKACTVVAMLEYGRRRWGAAGVKIKHPQDIFTLVRHYADRKQERFLCLSLNGAHEVLSVRVVTVGLLNRTIVHPREVFADVILDRAAALAVAHNHPSGRLQPSAEDDDITARLKTSAEVLDLRLLDHLVFCESAWFSYRQSGRMEELDFLFRDPPGEQAEKEAKAKTEGVEKSTGS